MAWEGWELNGSPAATLSGSVIRCTGGVRQTPRAQLRVNMRRGDKAIFIVEARALYGEGHLWGDVTTGSVLNIGSLQIDGHLDWRTYVFELVCPARYATAEILISCGIWSDETGDVEFRNPRVLMETGEVTDSVARNGFRLTDTGLDLYVKGAISGSIAAGATFVTLDDVIDAIDTYMDDSLDPDAALILANTFPNYTVPAKEAVNDFVLALKSASIWSLLDNFYVLAAGSAYSGKINWKSPATRLTANGGLAFEEWSGFTGNGTNGYLGAGVNLNALTQFTLNSASMFAYCLTDVNEIAADVGAVVGSSTGVLVSHNGSNMTGRANSATNLSKAVSTAVGLNGWTRRSSTTSYMFKNTSVSTTASTSSSLQNSELTIGRSGSGFSKKQIAIAGVGGALSDGQIAALSAACDAYIATVGAF